MKDVYIEYCNLPMRTAFQNTELSEQVRELLKGSKMSFENIKYAERTFRQLVCLSEGGNISKQMCEDILQVMHKEDERCPYPLEKAYPFLAEEHFVLNMREVSYFKVDFQKEGNHQFNIKRIAGVRDSRQRLVLYIYPEEDIRDKEFVNMEGDYALCIYPESKEALQELVKQILLQGTLNILE